MEEAGDIDQRVSRFRECVRIVWNLFILPTVDDAWEAFDNLERELFRALVLNELPSVEPQGRVYQRLCVSVAPECGSGQVLYAKSPFERSVEWSIVKDLKLDGGVACRFDGFFDWESDELRDFAYAQAIVTHSEHPDYTVGAGFLIPASIARYSLP